ncbi:hypothetical protein B0H63DRAFT_314531 [Podospora didyma]|uniref:DUF4048 domain-containing protein n=1 Tax=Podospora didyma TaxID=330526 RepID=A0AAE0K6F1_9PEZI|nr:hypothetical protein B0H63DRAFT_314531 [Podospora didyma]
MTSVVLLQTCFVSACANALFLRDGHPLNVHKASLVARRTTRPTPPPLVPWRRHRRNCVAPANPYRRRRTSCAAYYPEFLRKPSQSLFALHTSKLAKRIEPAPTASKEKEHAMEQVISLQQTLEGLMLDTPPTPRGQARFGRDHTEPRRVVPEEQQLPPPSPQMEELIETRSTRSASTASRSTNRLSLTLPIALPTNFPSRPTPISATSSSFPPTPLDTPSLTSPVDPNDFITAIAAQERRVLELREELSRAESDLRVLKRQWTTHEAHKKRAEMRTLERMRPLGPATDLQEDSATRRNVELDKRKKALLLGQQSQQGTPERGRRRFFPGGHARTLSLLSPTKPTCGFSVHEDAPEGYSININPGAEESDSPFVSQYAPVTPLPTKRASWAPRSSHQAAAQAAGGVKQIAQDLKSGLWTFMEDLRQATVGEEPITGQGVYLRGIDGNMRSTKSGSTSPSGYGDQDTIRATGANSRPRVATAFDESPTPATADGGDESGAAPLRQMRALSRSNTDVSSKSTKRFSWTPLTMDSYDDNDWSNWDSPSVSSPRWSGSTVNGDIIPAIPERRDENDTPLKKQSSKSHLASRSSPSSPRGSPNKFEELLPPVLNRLTPSNLKKTASEFMKEWEKSLSPPPRPEHTSFAAAASTATGEDNRA